MIVIRCDIPPNQKERKNLLTCALEQGFYNLVVLDEDREAFTKLGKFNLVSISGKEITMGEEVGEHIIIENKEDQDYALSCAGKLDLVVVFARNWKVIPVENLIAQFQGTKTKLLVEIENIEDARLFLETLEVGCDGIVLATTDINTIQPLRELLDEMEHEKLDLVSAKITRIRGIGSGDRVCIDCCSLLSVGEGMLIGSQSQGLFLVHSESVESEYVERRPFRVNAGPVHSYIMTPGNRTLYLSELRVGDEVLVVDAKGNCKSVVLGRVKIEKRPLVLLEAEYNGSRFNIILQNAETIRLISDEKPLSIVDLKVGDSVLIWPSDSARHFGRKINESITEK